MLEDQDPYAGARGNHSPTYLIVGEAYTTMDARVNKAFSSQGGRMLDRLLTSCGIDPKECLYSNVMNKQPGSNRMQTMFYKNAEVKTKKLQPTKGLFPKQEVIDGMQALHNLIEVAKPKFIIAMGNYALWALTDNLVNIRAKDAMKIPTGVGSYRGSHLLYKTNSGADIPLLPTYHIIAAERNRPWFYQISHDLSARTRIWREGDWLDRERNFIIRPSFETAVSTLLDILLRLDQGQEWLSVDIETRSGHIACIGFSWDDINAVCIPLMCVERDSGYWSAEEEFALIKLFSQILTHKKIKLTGQNFLFDAQYIWHYWHIRCVISWDTMIAQHLLYPGTELNLVMLSSLYNRYHRYWKDDSKFMQAGKDEDELWAYNCRDCVVTWEVKEGQEELIKQFDLEEQWGFQVEQQDAILDMMIRGVLVNTETKWLTSHELELAREEYIKELNRLLPEDFYPPRPKVSPWYTSHQQMTYIFTVMFGLPRYWNKQKRKYTMDDAALQHYGEIEPILKQLTTTLQQFRSIATYRTFTEMKLGFDNRMRSSFSPTAETFRWKSSSDVFGNGGNLQNIPKGQEE